MVLEFKDLTFEMSLLKNNLAKYQNLQSMLSWQLDQYQFCLQCQQLLELQMLHIMQKLK